MKTPLKTYHVILNLPFEYNDISAHSHDEAVAIAKTRVAEEILDSLLDAHHLSLTLEEAYEVKP